MALNPKKSTCMLIGTIHSTKHSSNISITIDDSHIECVDHQKILGVYIDRNLTWSIQTEKVYKKVNSQLALLRRIKPYLNQDMRELYYNAYVQPIFDYGNVLWCNSSMKYLNKILNTQKRAARMILDKSFDAPSAPLFKDLKWLPLPIRSKYHIGILVYKTLHNLSPSYMVDIMKTRADQSNYTLRSTNNKDIVQPLVKSRFSKITFQYFAAQVWNNIPLEIRNVDNLKLFRYKWKGFLISSSP